MLMPGKKRPSIGYFMYVLWLRSAVNNMMPVARIGGEVVAVRVMMKHGIRKTLAVASTVVELTMSVIAVFVFDIVGIALFIAHVGDKNIALKLAAGTLFALPAIIAMIVVQRLGFFGLLDKIFNLMFRETWKKYAGSAQMLDRAVHVMYRRYARVIGCGFWQLAAWVMGTGEIWLSLHFLGHTLPLSQAMMLEALIQASASAAFVVPGALGVQEAGFLFFGQMLGLSPEIAVAMAVMRRCRDILIFVPGLITWQIQEGRWLFRNR
jgi:putative membrane protein